MLTYLASPYSHKDPAIMERRHELACKAAGVLMLQGEVVFAPIAHSHHIGLHLNKSIDHDFWLRQDFGILAKCSQMIVLMAAGWQESVGVQAEIKFCAERGIPVRYLFPQDLGVEL